MEEFVKEYEKRISDYNKYKEGRKNKIYDLKREIEDRIEGRVIIDDEEPKKQYENDPKVHKNNIEIDLINQKMYENDLKIKQIENSKEGNLRDRMLITYSCSKKEIELEDRKKELEDELKNIELEYKKNFEDKLNKEDIEASLTRIKTIIQAMKKKRKEIKDFINEKIKEKEKDLSGISERLQPKIYELKEEIEQAEDYLKTFEEEEFDERLQKLKKETVEKIEKELIEKRIGLDGLQSYYNGEMEKNENQLKYLTDLLNNFKDTEKDFKEEIKSELKGLIEKLVDNKEEQNELEDNEEINELEQEDSSEQEVIEELDDEQEL